MGTANLPQNMGKQASPIIVMSNGVTSEESIKRAADVYGKIGAATKAAGIQLFLHNETLFGAAKTGGLKNYYIEQEQANGGWEAMVKGAAYLKTLT